MTADFLRFEFAGLMFAIIATVMYQLLNGRINTDGLFDQADPISNMRIFSPERVQLLVATLMGAGYYLLQVMNDPRAFPNIPDWLLWTQGGSSGIYVGGKSFRIYRDIVRSLTQGA